MKKSVLTSALMAALCLGGLSYAQGNEDARKAAYVAAVQGNYHPLFRSAEYPRWSAMTPNQAVIDTEAAVLIARRELVALCALTPEQMTFENTFIAYGDAVAQLEQSQQFLHHLTAVKDDRALQQVLGYLMGALHQFDAELMQNDRLWQVLKTASLQPWVKELRPEQQRIVEQTVQHFIHGGAELSPEQKNRKAAINTELGMLAMKYGNNIKAAMAECALVFTDVNELRGIDASRLAVAAADAQARGLSTPEKPAWVLTFTNGLVQDAIRSCNVAETRRKCWEASKYIAAEGKYDNAPVIARMMELRQEYAQLIGYDNYADMKAANRMVKDGHAALAFVDGLLAELKPAFDEENARLLQYISRLKNEEVTTLDPWDELKYSSMMAGEHFAFNTASIRPYLERERVVQGLFELCSRLFGVTYKEVPTLCPKNGEAVPEGVAEVWHPEVKLYAVYDSASGEHLGSFYLDLVARQGKRQGAWCMPITVGNCTDEGNIEMPHLAALMASFNRPAPGEPVLFSHPELQILFHEFGHMMHYMLGRTRYRRQSSPCIAWDFAELPSQLLENWAWQPEVLATFAFHHKTGEAYPEELLKKLAASRSFMPATNHLRSLSVAKLDLEMHLHYAEKFANKSLDEVCAEMLAPWTAPFTVSQPSVMRNLLHCFQGGYAAGYYSYKWSETLSTDAFLRFKKDGLFNAETGAAYRKEILEPGDSKPAAEIYRNFMGREPDPDALLKSQGLK